MCELRMHLNGTTLKRALGATVWHVELAIKMMVGPTQCMAVPRQIVASPRI